MEPGDPPKAGELYHGLTEGHLIMMSKIMLCWGAATNFLGRILCSLYGIKDEHDQVDLVQVLDTRKKIDLLRKFAKRRRPNLKIAPVVSEITSIYESYSEFRNQIAHAFGVTTADGASLASAKKQNFQSADQLPKEVEKAEYFLGMTIILITLLAGKEPTWKWPKKPA